MAPRRASDKRDREQPASAQEQSFARRSWKWIAGAVLAGLAAIISGYVVKANNWLTSKVHTERPITAVVRTNDLEPGNGWFFQSNPTKLRPPGLSQAAHRAWVRQHGGIPASGYHVTVVLQAAEGKTVVVDGLRVEATRRDPAPIGMSPDERGCGEELQPALFEANLDTSPVKVTPKSGLDFETGKPVAPKPLPRTISNSSPDYWHIGAVTSKWDADWVALIDYTVDGKPGTLKVDDHGKPFRTVALSKAVGVRAVYDPPASPRWQILSQPRPPIC